MLLVVGIAVGAALGTAATLAYVWWTFRDVMR